jgi:hypothetical protein
MARATGDQTTFVWQFYAKTKWHVSWRGEYQLIVDVGESPVKWIVCNPRGFPFELREGRAPDVDAAKATAEAMFAEMSR